MNKDKINLSPQELVTLALSLSLCLSQKFSLAELGTIRQFLSCVCSNLSLFECGQKSLYQKADKKL